MATFRTHIFAGIAASLLTATTIAATSGSPGAGAAPAAVGTPIRAAFYYPWFPETWHATDHATPVLGRYNSADATTLARHVTMARHAGLDAFIVSYWGRQSTSAKRLPLLLNAARAQGFHIAPYYELESVSPPPSAAAMGADFAALAQQSQGEPAWLRVGNRPVMFTYNTGAESTCAAVSRVKAASAGRFYLNMKVFAGYRNCAEQPDSWHQYGPAVGYDQQSAFSATVSPGFFKYNEATPRLARNVSAFRANLARQVASGAKWQLTTTFNEWGEGTSVEPATAWQSASGDGRYLDAMHDVYGSTPTPTPTVTKPAPTPTPTPTVTKPTPTPTPTVTKPPPTPTPSTTPPVAGGAVTKVLVFVEENHSLTQMKAGMPYLFAQAARYGYASNYKASTHPSLPNYLAIASGSTHGVTDDKPPSAHPVAAPSVFGAALAAHRTAKSYQESMPSPCATSSAGPYAVKHNPWAYVGAERAQCQSGDVPSGTVSSGALHTDITTGTLPNVGEVTPNLNNDAHDGSLATADAWLRGWLTSIYAGPDWSSGHLAVVIVADEDNGSQGNLVLTTVLHPSQHAHVVTAALTHYSLTTLLSSVGHAPCIALGCSAPSFANAFGLTIG